MNRISLVGRIGLILLFFTLPSRAGLKDHQLDIYFIDVEGVASTLIVTPACESLLVDTGNPWTRDSCRILEAAKVAGLSRIDYQVITHYHVDHMGGLADLVKLIPVGTLYDNEDENPSRDKPSAEFLAAK